MELKGSRGEAAESLNDFYLCCILQKLELPCLDLASRAVGGPRVLPHWLALEKRLSWL